MSTGKETGKLCGAIYYIQKMERSDAGTVMGFGPIWRND
jgi:hypothetical protein